MNITMIRAAFVGVTLGFFIISPAEEAERLHPRQSKLFSEITTGNQRIEEVLPPRIRGDRNQPAQPLASTPRRRTSSSLRIEAKDMPVVAGGVIYSDSWGDSKKYGVYTLSPASSTLVVDKAKATDGGVLKDNVFYAHELENDALFGPTVYSRGYDITTGEKVYDGESYFANRAAADMTVDPTTGIIYGIFWKDDDMSGYMLGRLVYNPSGPKVSKIVDLPGDWCAIACDDEGYIYAIRREITDQTVTSSALYMIVDPYEGTVAKIGDTGQLPFYQSSMTYDSSANRMLWNVCPADNTGAIYEVSLTTGQATLLYNLPGNEEIMGLYVPAKTEGGIPASPTDMAFDFVGGSLEGTVSFTAPSMNNDGSTLEGTLTWSMTVDGNALLEGSCVPGESVKVAVRFDNGGKHEVSVTVSNGKGASQPLKDSFYAGFATPMAPTNVVMTVEGDNSVTVTWDPVTSPVTKGYFNAAEVRYCLVQNPGNVTVFENTDQTSYSTVLPAAEGYTVYNFTVTAIMGNVRSTTSKSNSFSVGTIEPPYIEDFASADALDAFTVIGRWKYEKKGYVYSAFADGNSWLITPAIKLRGGRTYKLTFDALAEFGSWDAEKMEVRMGSAPTQEAMTTVVLEPFEITSTSFVGYSAFITPEADGLYYIGFRNLLSDAWGLDLDNISIEAPIDNSVPAAITDFTAHGDADGDLKVNISLTAPKLTFTGEELAELDRIEIFRESDIVHTFIAPLPGEFLSWVDETPLEGVNKYTATAYTNVGASEPAQATAFAGLDKPAMPANLKVVEVSDGVVTLTWDCVTSGIHGGPINPDLITYDVASYRNGDMEIYALQLKDTAVTFRAIAEGSQEYMQFVIFPIIAGEGNADEIEGEPAISAQTVIGTADNGFRESFRGGVFLSTLALEKGDKGGVALHTDADGVPSQDCDNGIIAISGSAIGAKAAILSGKINLEGMVAPALTFYTFTLVDDKTGHMSNNKLEVSIAEPGAPFDSELVTSISEIGSEKGWHMVTVPLDRYAGKTIIFKIAAEVVNFSYTPIDNIRVGSTLDHDIAITTVGAPSYVRTGDDYKVSVLYSNLGTRDLEAFDLALYADDELVQTLTCGKVAAGATGARQFSVTMHPLSTDDVSLQVRALLATDGNEENNVSTVVSVKPMLTAYPTVTDLQGRLDGNGKPTLNWSEPEYDDFAVPVAVTESLENAAAFATTLEGWTFVDGDRLPTGTFKSVKFPAIEDGSLQSFWIVDASSEVIPPRYSSSFAALSGAKYLVAMYARNGRNDDWAISPELSGEMQYVSFYAKSYSSSVAEEFEVLASSNSTDITDFTVVGKVSAVPNSWTSYEFLLPAGSRHFAIRYCANDAMMLMIDDIRYVAAGADDRLTLTGFNIYRDGVRVNALPVEDFEYTDTETSAMTNTYVATAVYKEGESAGSNPVVIMLSSIGDTVNERVCVTSDEGFIMVSGAEGLHLTIHTPDGITVASLTATAHTCIPVASGIYIVKVGATTVKMAVH